MRKQFRFIAKLVLLLNTDFVYEYNKLKYIVSIFQIDCNPKSNGIVANFAAATNQSL